jgi:hypothetical protein
MVGGAISLVLPATIPGRGHLSILQHSVTKQQLPTTANNKTTTCSMLDELQ